MALVGDMVVTVATVASIRPNSVGTPWRYTGTVIPRHFAHSPLKYGSSGFVTGLKLPENSKWPSTSLQNYVPRNKSHPRHACTRNMVSSRALNEEAETLVLNALRMKFLERLSLAWKILFPSPAARKNSNAKIAKQRLKMILFSDRCDVSDDAKQKIVSNIVAALSDFVEIDSQDKVQLSISTDPDLGTMYSVTIPVRRVKPEYQDCEDNYRGITNIECIDTGEKSGSVDVRFEFSVPTKSFPK